MRCDEVERHLPGFVDGEIEDPGVAAHVASCLRCQAEVVRYRRLLRALASLRSRRVDAPLGALDDTLVALASESDRRIARALLTGRRIAVASGIAGTVAAGATVAALVARNRRRTPSRPGMSLAG